MSLVTAASLWTNEDNPNTNAKRVSSMRKPARKCPNTSNASPSQPENSSNPIMIEKGDNAPYSIEEEHNMQDDRSERVSKVINNMSNIHAQNDGNNLVDFVPISPPNIQNQLDTEASAYGRTGDDEIPNPNNSLFNLPKRLQPGDSNYSPARSDLGVSNNPSQTNKYGSYRRVYEPPTIQPVHYGNVETNGTTHIDNRVMEKINYMIHMLEQQHNEKTSNVTEEFILYMFLGVFIIFIVDSFALSGKYTR
jgi:hypothetical protein